MLYEKYSLRLYRMAYQVTQQPENAEEIVQDVFFQIWRWPRRWDPNRGSFLSWALTVTRYTAIDHIRRKQNQPSFYPLHEEYNQAATHPSPDTGADHTQLARAVRESLKKLPHEQRAVILLAFFRGMTHEDIAKHLSLPLGTVKSRIRLGMKKLKDDMTEKQKQSSSN